MGIRIHKVLCYFTENNTTEINDDLLETPIKDVFKTFDNNPEYMKYIEGAGFLHNVLIKGKSVTHALANNIIFNPECIGEHSLGFIPTMLVTSWKRWDDDIDYQEFYTDYPNGVEYPYIKYLKRSIWPYEGYFDKNTLKPFLSRSDIVNMYNCLKSTEGIVAAEKYVQDMSGYTSFAKFNQNIIPYIPEEIRYMIKFLGLPDELYTKLRPAIVTYWS